MSLCVRRPMQIGLEDSGPPRITYLEANELIDDAGVSQLYGFDAKSQLFGITTLICKLCRHVTPVLDLVYSEKASCTLASTEEDFKRLDAAETELQLWYEAAQLQLSLHKELEETKTELNDMILLQINLLWIYHE